MPPRKPCPNPACGELIHDWHAEWISKKNRTLVFMGQAGVDCPECGASILIPGDVVSGIAPDTLPRVKRSRAQASNWAAYASTTLDAYLKTLEGSQYTNYQFES
jgi:hypothetical protein